MKFDAPTETFEEFSKRLEDFDTTYLINEMDKVRQEIKIFSRKDDYGGLVDFFRREHLVLARLCNRSRAEKQARLIHLEEKQAQALPGERYEWAAEIRAERRLLESVLNLSYRNKPEQEQIPYQVPSN